MIIITIAIAVGLGCFLAGFFYSNNKNSYKNNIDDIQKKAQKLGVDDKNLTKNLGNIKTNHYELLLRVRTEETFRMSKNAQMFAIIAAVAAILSAVAAITSAFH